MYLRKRIVKGLLVGGWVLLAFCGSANAQGDLESVISGTPPSRSGWEQRVVGGTALRNSRVSSPGQWQSATGNRIDPWAEARVVSMAADGPSGVIVEAPPAADEGYDPRLDPVPMGDGSEFVEEFETYPGPHGYPRRFSRPGPYAGYGPGWEGWWLRNFSFFAGVQGFTGPVDDNGNRGNGNFGFHEGFNFGKQMGGPWLGIGNPWGLGIQAGFQAVHSNLYGTDAGAPLGPGDNRSQLFFTGGVFRRALEGGVQWGVAIDALRDQYFGQADLCQIRVEASYVRCGRGEIGFWGAYGTKGDDIRMRDQAVIQLESISQNVFFLRRYFSGGGEGRLWAGFTGDSDGLLGGDLRLPLGTNWAIENRFNFLLPKEGRGADGMREESWAVRMQLVWYPHRSARCVRCNRFRPLLNVADNAVFMVGRQ